MNKDYSKEDQIIAEAILNARKIQDFLWGDPGKIETLSFERQINLLQKRIDNIREIDRSNLNYKVELRKRLLQNAALSIKLLSIMQDES